MDISEAIEDGYLTVVEIEALETGARPPRSLPRRIGDDQPVEPWYGDDAATSATGTRELPPRGEVEQHDETRCQPSAAAGLELAEEVMQDRAAPHKVAGLVETHRVSGERPNGLAARARSRLASTLRLREPRVHQPIGTRAGCGLERRGGPGCAWFRDRWRVGAGPVASTRCVERPRWPRLGASIAVNMSSHVHMRRDRHDETRPRQALHIQPERGNPGHTWPGTPPVLRQRSRARSPPRRSPARW